METEHLKQLRAILDELQHKDINKLTPTQLELILQAKEVLTKADKEAKKKKADWPTMVNLAIQAAKLIIEMLMSGGS